MNELITIKKDKAVTSSLKVAEMFHKSHAHVLRDIQSLDCSKDFTESNFGLSRYKDATGKYNPFYYITKDGFAFLVMGYRGKRAAQFKEDYIKAFNLMENTLKERSTAAWVETRAAGKLTRKAETDTLQRLVEYAREQGSTHADMLYITYTKLANKMAGVQRRDTASLMQLNNLSMMESIILHMVDTGIMMQKHYKEIYQDCKARLQTVSELAFIGAST